METASLYCYKSFRGCLGRNALKSIDRTFLSKVFPGKKFAVGIILTWCFQSFAIAEGPRARVARRSFGRGATVPVDWGSFVTLVRAWDPERGSIEPPRRVSNTSRPSISPEAARKGAAVVVWSHGLVTSSRDFEFQGCLRKEMTVTYSQVPSQSQGIGTIPVTADTYRTEEVSGEGDRTKGGAEAIDHDVSSVPEPDHLGAGVPDDDTREDVGALRREVLEVAEAATRGDEIAAVSAMVTAAETAALREAMGGPHVPPDHPRDPSEDEIRPDAPPEDEDKNAVAATFGARRRLNLEAVDHGADVWRGSSVLGGGVRGARLASASLSAGPDTQEALRDLGYSSRGWESVEASECDRSAATPGYAAGGPPSTIDSQGLSAAPRVSDGEGTQRKTCLLYTSPSPRDQRGSRMPSSA